MNASVKILGLFFFVVTLFACGGGTDNSSPTPVSILESTQRAKILSATVASSGLIPPVAFSIQQGYEWLEDTGSVYRCSAGKVFHPGADLNKRGTAGNSDMGEPLYAIADGEVVYADDSHWASLIMKFQFAGRSYYAVYGHSEIDSGSQEVKDYERQVGKTFTNFATPFIGMRVRRGQIVGLLWNNNTENAHLHFEIRSSEHPSPANGTDFCGYYGGKSKTEMSRMNRDPLGFVVSNGYIDGTCRMLDPSESVGAFCWTSSPVGQFASCEQGANHIQYTVSSNRSLWIVAGFSQSAVSWYCSHLSSNIMDIKSYLGRVDTSAGGDDGGWPGAGYILGATDSPESHPPDFVATRAWLETPWGAETYRYGWNETIKMKGKFENIGDGPCASGETDGIVLHVYLSIGYKEDPHSGDRAWQRVGADTISCSSLKPGDTHTDTESLIIRNVIPKPGIWNIVWCIDHPQNDHNNGGDHREKHESNNCSSESVFEVTADLIVNVPNTDIIVSDIRVKGGAIRLPANGLTNLQLAIRNIGTLTPPAGDLRSNYSFCGPLPSTACVQVADDGSEASNLTPGRDLWEETLSPIRAPALVGKYLLKGCADYQGVVSESNEDNNCLTTPVEVVDVKPDFIVSALGLREGTTIKSGTRVHPWCTVTNVGVGPSPSAMRLAYYINANEYRDSDDVSAAELCVGCSRTEEVKNNDIKLGDKGTRTYRCCADYLGTVSESNEGNNCATVTFTVKK